MTVVALALVSVLAVVTVAFAGALRSQQRAHARREDLLLNQLLHAAGKTWQPPPAAEKPEPTAAALPQPRRFTASPERFPDDPFNTDH